MSVNVHGHVDVHNVTILEGPTGLEMRSVSEFVWEKKRNSLVWDPVTEDVVDARTT
jgi:hypothetical protein